jgi:hypothetical protein
MKSPEQKKQDNADFIVNFNFILLHYNDYFDNDHVL